MEQNETAERNHHHNKNSSSIFWMSTAVVVVACIFINSQPFASLRRSSSPSKTISPTEICYRSCRLTIVESVPQNATVLQHHLPSTFDAWKFLIQNAKNEMDVAAYKSSLRGKHVLSAGEAAFARQGDSLFEELMNAGLERNVRIRIVENTPSKDKGDNADAISLAEMGAAERRPMNLRRLSPSGIMHSKFLLADQRHFYVGSSNLDWRSLSQKFEIGVLVRDCPCLGSELKSVFDLYWNAAEAETVADIEALRQRLPVPKHSMEKPLRVQYHGVDADVYISTSPRVMNAVGQTWDLDAIVAEIRRSRTSLLISVMDYFPMFMYSANKEFWPVIDNAVREAVLRGVRVRIIAAALHFPKTGLSFLRSLEAMNGVGKGSVDVRIFKVPTDDQMGTVIRRERRTHKKFFVTDDAVLIGTSNWSADYFEGLGTGVAITVRQNHTQPFVTKMRDVFERDWESPYSHILSHYIASCIDGNERADFCEIEKDKSLLASRL